MEGQNFGLMRSAGPARIDRLLRSWLPIAKNCWKAGNDGVKQDEGDAP